MSSLITTYLFDVHRNVFLMKQYELWHDYLRSTEWHYISFWKNHIFLKYLICVYREWSAIVLCKRRFPHASNSFTCICFTQSVLIYFLNLCDPPQYFALVSVVSRISYASLRDGFLRSCRPIRRSPWSLRLYVAGRKAYVGAGSMASTLGRRNAFKPRAYEGLYRRVVAVAADVLLLRAIDDCRLGQQHVLRLAEVVQRLPRWWDLQMGVLGGYREVREAGRATRH